MIELAQEIRTARLILEPLATGHVGEMVEVLGHHDLYNFIGGSPPSLDELTVRYARQLSESPAPNEQWLNWIMRLRREAVVVGFVQATVTDEEADVAWVVGVPWQGGGLAKEAAAGMIGWLASQGVTRFGAHIHTQHLASQSVAQSLHFKNSGEVDGDGEEIWEYRLLLENI